MCGGTQSGCMREWNLKGKSKEEVMKKIKVDRYSVHEKDRTYEVLSFPFIKYMWAFDNYEEEDCLMVDGCKEAFMWMKYAFAILANYPDKVIYFPCKQDGIQGYYNKNYHLVLCRPEEQLRRSLWPRIIRKLDSKHAAGKFVLLYDRKKLDDYYEKGLWKRYPVETEHHGRKSIQNYELKKGYQTHVEEIVGDTVFMVLNRVECFEYHYRTAKDLDEYCPGKNNYIWGPIGWILSDGNIRGMIEEQEKSRKKVSTEVFCFEEIKTKG